MVSINNLTWKAKLTSGFIFLALLVGLVGYIGTRELYTIDSAGNNIYSVNLLAINDLNHMRSTFLENRSLLILMFYTRDKTQQYQELRQQITDNSTSEKYRKDYEKAYLGTLSDEEKQDYTEYKTIKASYNSMRDNLIQILDSGNNDQAEIELGQVLKTCENVLSPLDKLIAFNENEANKREASNKNIYEHTRLVMLEPDSAQSQTQLAGKLSELVGRFKV